LYSLRGRVWRGQKILILANLSDPVKNFMKNSIRKREKDQIAGLYVKHLFKKSLLYPSLM